MDSAVFCFFFFTFLALPYRAFYILIKLLQPYHQSVPLLFHLRNVLIVFFVQLSCTCMHMHKSPRLHLPTRTLTVFFGNGQYIDGLLLHRCNVAKIAHAGERLIVHTSPMAATTDQNNNNKVSQ